MKMFPNALFLSTLVSLLGPGMGAAPDAAAQQTGGLPALAARVDALQTAVTSLQTTVASLQAANTSLQNALNQETAARVAGDNALQTALNQETGARVAGDKALQTALNQETAQRSAAVASVQAALTDLQILTGEVQTEVFRSPIARNQGPFDNNSGTIVASVTIPPGDYLFQAVVDVINIDSDQQTGGCLLEQIPPGSTSTNTPFPDLNAATNAPGAGTLLRLEGEAPFTSEPVPEQAERLTLLTTAHVPTQAQWVITCVGFHWVTGARFPDNPGGELVAVKVAAIN